jgi:hypothetical protein
MNSIHGACGWLKNDNRPGNPGRAMQSGAKTRPGAPCKSPAMRNGRCRMHGGASTGPRTAKGLQRSRRANWKTEQYSAQAKADRRVCILLNMLVLLQYCPPLNDLMHFHHKSSESK